MIDIPPSRLFLHVGLPKAASSAMQSWFRDHRGKMRQLGVWYPTAGTQHHAGHAVLFNTVFAQPQSQMLQRALGNARADTLLMSWEGLSDRLDLLPQDRLDMFREKTKTIETTLIVISRDRQAWLNSYFKECAFGRHDEGVPWRATGLSFADFCALRPVQAIIDTDTLIPRLRHIFGAQNILHLRLEDPNWFATLLDRLGLAGLAHLDLPGKNEATPDWMVYLMQHINGQEPQDPRRLSWMAAMQLFQPTGHARLINLARRRRPTHPSDLDIGLIAGARSTKSATLTPQIDQSLAAFETFLDQDLRAADRTPKRTMCNVHTP